MKRTVTDVWPRLINIFQASKMGAIDVYIVSQSDWRKLPPPYFMLNGIPYCLIGKAVLVFPSKDFPQAAFYEIWESLGHPPQERLSERQFYSNFMTPLLVHELAHLAVADAFRQTEDDLGFTLGLNETMANIGLALATQRQSHNWPFYLSSHKDLLRTPSRKAESPLAVLMKNPLKEGLAVYGLFQAMSLDFVDELCQEIPPEELAQIFGSLKGSKREALDTEFSALISAASNRLRDNKFLVAISGHHTE